MQPEPPPDSIPSPVGTSRFRLGRLRSPQELTAALQSHIVGQEAAIDAAVRALTISAAGLRDPNRPIASLLLVGPTGVGKTELAKQLACQVTGDPDNLCRIDMNTLAQEHYSASLAGAPPGYAGAKEGLTLFDPALIAGNHSRPGLVLFDEVEKAHATVLRSLLQILDSGVLRLSAGNETIDFRNAIVLFTSNLGSAEVAAHERRRRGSSSLQRLAAPFRPGARRDSQQIVADVVEQFFDPELYNRFDEVVHFAPLTQTSAAKIVDLELVRLRNQLSAIHIDWMPDDDVRSLLINKGFDSTYGARHMKRTVRTTLLAPIAEAVVTAPDADNQSHHTLSTTVAQGGIVATVTRAARS
ncbi:Chaperone protein ClpB [Rhodococcus erythropolis]|uniref:AAA family ATPase n=1 Tax=Rhodococcus erythropolis TaxID=1833 RepID=UPI000BB30889|nr:AAA family ATPase [Rhodococcus erythropolis]PBI91139.1 Chaperone protein ClpB [Rhodococcus erythropolis]